MNEGPWRQGSGVLCADIQNDTLAAGAVPAGLRESTGSDVFTVGVRERHDWILMARDLHTEMPWARLRPRRGCWWSLAFARFNRKVAIALWQSWACILTLAFIRIPKGVASMSPINIPSSPNDRICDCQGLAAHKVPRMPTMIDQTRADPRDVREFSGRPLHTVVDADALNGKMLQIFTNKDAARAMAQSLPKKSSSLPPRVQSDGSGGHAATSQQTLTAGVPPDSGYLELYEDVDFGGCLWRLLEQHSHTVGNYGNLWACGFLWWGWKSADNAISSFDIKVSADSVTFFDAINLDFGNFSNTLWMPGDAWVPNLVPFGWNDRISSHLLWYFG